MVISRISGSLRLLPPLFLVIPCTNVTTTLLAIIACLLFLHLSKHHNHYWTRRWFFYTVAILCFLVANQKYWRIHEWKPRARKCIWEWGHVVPCARIARICNVILFFLNHRQTSHVFGQASAVVMVWVWADRPCHYLATDQSAGRIEVGTRTWSVSKCSYRSIEVFRSCLASQDI